MVSTSVCPACERPRSEGATECPHCGVIFARFRARPGQGAAASAPLPLPPSALTPLTHSGSGRPRLLAALSARQLESFLIAAGEGLSAGLTPAAFARGAGAALLPPRLAPRLVERVEASGSFVEFLDELGLPGRGDAAVLRAAEKRGELPGALRALAQVVEARRQAMSRLLAQLLYPALLLLAWILIEPLALLITSGLGAYARRVLPASSLLLAAAALVPYLGLRLHPRSPIRRWLVAPLAFVPLVSGVVLRRARARFAEVLGSGLRAGLPLLEALSLAGGGLHHPSFRRRLGEVSEAILAGRPFHVALEALPFTREERAWIQHGETSGTLDQALARLAARNREEAQLRVRVIAALSGVLFAVFVLARLVLGTVEAYRGYFRMLDGLLEPLLGTGGLGGGLPD